MITYKNYEIYIITNNFLVMKLPKITPIFLFGPYPHFLMDDGLSFVCLEDKIEQERRADRILSELGLRLAEKVIIRTDEELRNLNINSDAFIIFAHAFERNTLLIILAHTGKPIILTGKEGAIGFALDIYEYLSDFANVSVAFNYDEVREIVNNIRIPEPIIDTKVCLFDSGERLLSKQAWYSNPLFKGMLNIEYADMNEFESRYRNADIKEAEDLAKRWMGESVVGEPTFDDIVRQAMLYIAMKGIMDNMNTNIGYVLWCGHFTEMLGAKMCYAITKLNDDGYLTGCWRGGNLLSMLILHKLTDAPVFVGEFHSYKDGVLSLQHCAVPTKMSKAKPVLRRWRDMDGTVSAFCDMPGGTVTLINTGSGKRVVVMKGEVICSKDLGGENCRNTVFIRLDNPELVHKITGREFAMVYGDYVDEAKEIVVRLGIKVI